MNYLPLFHDLAGVRCMVVGGGTIALRKAELLVRAGAVVEVVAPEIRDDLRELVESSGGSIAQRTYAGGDAAGMTLTVVATNDATVNARVAEEVRSAGGLVNVVDDATRSNVIFGSIIDRDPVLVALSSAGTAPVLLRLLRERIEALLPSRIGALARFAGRLRGRVKSAIADGDGRRRFWEGVLEGPIASQVLAGNEASAERAFDAALARPARTATGEVFLVGAGPGDPDLLTLRALQLMQRADVVLYDNLVSRAILDRTRRDAERIYVGKRREFHAVRQEGINEMLVRLARQGQRVLRLKGGDPFVFGRGGEEIASLAAHGIPFQVVPGITAANGCAAWAGIPLTHRDHARSVRFVAAVGKDGRGGLDWADLVRSDETLVFYMGLASLDAICSELVAHGRAPSTPAALIEKGTLPEQRVFIGTLADLRERVAGANVHGPTLIVVGEVVGLAGELSGYGQDTERSQAAANATRPS